MEPKRRGRPRREDDTQYAVEDVIQKPHIDSVETFAEPQPVPFVEIDDAQGEIEKREDTRELLKPSLTEMETARDEKIVFVADPAYKPVVPEGWFDIFTAPRSGIPIEMMDSKMNKATVHWKRTRAFANPTHRWEETGFWANEISGQKIDFVPEFWKYPDRRR
jgi:hypothetical protein